VKVIETVTRCTFKTEEEMKQFLENTKLINQTFYEHLVRAVETGQQDEIQTKFGVSISKYYELPNDFEINGDEHC
jgi:hypothetical protein